jgi:hypothetical protein
MFCHLKPWQYTFNINLAYETYEHQNQELVMPKLSPISLVLPSWKDPMQMRGNMPWVFTPTPILLGLLEGVCM